MNRAYAHTSGEESLEEFNVIYNSEAHTYWCLSKLIKYITIGGKLLLVLNICGSHLMLEDYK